MESVQIEPPTLKMFSNLCIEQVFGRPEMLNHLVAPVVNCELVQLLLLRGEVAYSNVVVGDSIRDWLTGLIVAISSRRMSEVASTLSFTIAA